MHFTFYIALSRDLSEKIQLKWKLKIILFQDLCSEPAKCSLFYAEKCFIENIIPRNKVLLFSFVVKVKNGLKHHHMKHWDSKN